jgi:hypothetical protein
MVLILLAMQGLCQLFQVVTPNSDDFFTWNLIETTNRKEFRANGAASFRRKVHAILSFILMVKRCVVVLEPFAPLTVVCPKTSRQAITGIMHFKLLRRLQRTKNKRRNE